MQYSEMTLIIGHVGRDADIKYTQGGQAVCNFSVAIDKGKDQNGQDRPAKWYNVSAWDKLAEVCGKYVKKGMLVQVVGTATARGYTDQSGKSRASLDLSAWSVQFLSRADGNGQQSSTGGDYDSSYAPASGPSDMDDIPF